MAHLRSFPPVIISAAEMVWYVENARCCEAQSAINLYGAIIRYGGRGRFVRLRSPLSMLPSLQAPYAGPDELAPPAHTRRRGVGRGRPVDAVRESFAVSLCRRLGSAAIMYSERFPYWWTLATRRHV